MMEKAYKNYLIEDAKILPNMSKERMLEFGFRLTKEEFINKIKTDEEFAKTWDVIVEVRKLSMEERWEIANLTPNMSEFYYCNKLCDEYSVPTRAISLTYDNRTEVIYEV